MTDARSECQYKLISSHSSSHPFHTQIQSFWQSGHTKLMLWQIFLQTNTYAFAHGHTKGSRQGHFLWNEGGDISSTLSQGEGIDSF